jgi:3-deoxy-manno-octulosonate cytidylyltransferase (CMP-KDO synthetase)
VNAIGIIPARFAATRLPGKPLVEIAGKPMLEHVWRRSREAKRLAEILVATDDPRIAEACARFGARAVMTSPSHPTGTDRVAEVAAGLDCEIVVNIQGDEPLIEAFVIDALVDELAAHPNAAMSTVAHAAAPGAEADPNRVKLVMDQAGRALYFSRAAIPYFRSQKGGARIWQHAGLYAYRRAFLAEFVRLPQTPLEQAESLEQLRALEVGAEIRVAVIDGWESVPVDVPEDVARVEARLRR